MTLINEKLKIYIFVVVLILEHVTVTDKRDLLFFRAIRINLFR